jgi:hypothetical protein
LGSVANDDLPKTTSVNTFSFFRADVAVTAAATTTVLLSLQALGLLRA